MNVTGILIMEIFLKFLVLQILNLFHVISAFLHLLLQKNLN